MGARTVAPPAALLSVDTVCAYVSERLGSLTGAPLATTGAKLSAREVHGGNINYAFEVMDGAGASVFVKQAPPYFKLLGSDAKLHPERLHLEVQVLEEMAAVLCDRAKEFLPGLYLFDPHNMVFICEFLRPHRELQESLYAGEVSQEIAAKVGAFMGLLHSRTHSSRVAPEEVKRMSSEYANCALRDVHLEFTFARCFREDPRAAHLRDDAGFMGAVQELKDIYAGSDAGNLALLHGDLHAGSIMADAATGSAKVIDPEFCVYGPPGLDVGFLVSTYAQAYCLHAATGSGSEGEILAAIGQVWDSYAREMLAGGVPAAAVEASCREAAGFAGCEVVRRSLPATAGRLGEAYGHPLRLLDPAAKAEVERQALAIGAESIRGRQRGVVALTDALEKYGSY